MQKPKQLNNERIYSLDALRGIMMMLGIVIHAAITYGKTEYAAWSLKDTNSNQAFFDYLVSFIHVFRMPVFMVAAGYFGALLFYRKGGAAMLRNRINRILIPLAAGVLIIFPLVIFSFTYSKSAILGDPDAWSRAVSVISSGDFLPFKTAHLWFIYYLVLFSLAGFFIATIFNRPGRVSDRINEIFKMITLNFWLRLFCSTLVVFVCLYAMGTNSLKTNATFIIDWVVFFTYFIFYSTGWMLYRAACLQQLSKYAWPQLSIATLMFLLNEFAPWPNESWVLPSNQVLTAISTSLFVFGFIALFLTYFHSYSPRLSYLMESAYWVYIIHLPVVAFIPGLIAPYNLPALVKFLIVLGTTTLISMVSYHYLVRNTIIGLFLNGKVHNNKQPVGKLAAFEQN